MHQRGFPTNQKSGRPHVTLSFTEAPLMRLSVGRLRQVVKRDLPIEFVPQQLTSYGGLELLHRYVRRLGLYPRLRRACADLGGDYGGARLSPVAARAVLRRGAAGGASEVSRRRPARPPIQRAGPDAHGAHGHEFAAPIYAPDAPAADPAQPGARARVAGSPSLAPPDPPCPPQGRP